ncbi:hypothetical protein BC828DRAFT_406852 [Blastocladiella britannica]|nr:hypothetical protein BC828DRAFT_406852 [Blastocladiella britannica]
MSFATTTNANKNKLSLLLLLITLVVMGVPSAHGHGAITGVKGIGGPEGKALGIVDTTPRTGTTRKPFQQDTSIIRDREIKSGRTGPCGRTLGGGNNDIAAGVKALMAELGGGLPMVAAGMPLTMTVHQINADGAGPYICALSADGTGKDFTPVKVTMNLPGVRGRNARTSLKDQALMVTMPGDLKCTGGAAKNMCLVRCRNAAAAGPFGGCVPVQQMVGAAAIMLPSSMVGQNVTGAGMGMGADMGAGMGMNQGTDMTKNGDMGMAKESTDMTQGMANGTDMTNGTDMNMGAGRDMYMGTGTDATKGTDMTNGTDIGMNQGADMNMDINKGTNTKAGIDMGTVTDMIKNMDMSMGAGADTNMGADRIKGRQ